MTHRILRAADHRRMPWKNGRGETVEIAVWPEGAGLEDFGWRVSMAGVTEDGAFSIFAQVDRSLAVLTGDGIELQIQGMGLHRLLRDGPPLCFPADAPCAARLLGQPITDLNVMTRRGVFAHRLIRSQDAMTGDADDAADWRLVLATRPVTLELAGQAIALDPLDVLFCDGPEAALPIGPAPGTWIARISRA